MTAWPDLAAYKAWARIEPADVTDDGTIGPALAAATDAVIERCRNRLAAEGAVDPATGLPASDCPPDVSQAVLLWTNRLVARRNSPAGVVGVADTGPVTVPSRDADITRLLAPWRDVVAG